MSGILSAFIGRVAGVVTDAYFNLVTLLLPGNGTNGAQNNTFLDSSSNNFTITRNGNTTQGTFSPFSQTGWSNYFDGTSDYLTAVGSNLALGTGDFTIEFWFYANAYSATTDSSFMFDSRSGNNTSGFFIGPVFNNTQTLHVGQNTSPIITASTTYSLNTWIHCAVVRSSGTITLYQNGVNVGSVANTTNNTATTNYIASGWWLPTGSGQTFNGYLNNLRISNTARYTSGFTPPTAAFSSDANTRLLACQSNRFVDSSSNGYAVTPYGTPSVQTFSPFAPTAAYDAAVVGASGYFDGSGDYLSNSSDTIIPSTGDFTAQFWIYPTQVSSLQYLIATTNNSGNKLHLYINSSAYVGVQTGASYRDSSTTKVVANAWNHIACTRTGSTYALFVNGVSQSISGVGTMASTLDVTPTYIAARDAGNGAVSGYLGSSKITTVVETISVPTAPYTSDGNTRLLTNFTNAGITDATAKNDLETVGNAQISTTQSKFGGSSMYFDGTGDYLITPYMNLFDMWRGDLTVEGWVYFNSVANTPHLFMFAEPMQGGNRYAVVVYVNGSVVRLYTQVGGTGGDKITGTTTLATGQWYHVALTKSGTTFTLWVNGVSQGTSTTTVYPFGVNERLTLGFQSDSGVSGDYLNGYMDDVRITRGYARYTSAFTPPSAAFALQ